MKTIFTLKDRLIPKLSVLIIMSILMTVNVSAGMKHVITVADYKFTPSELTISIGDTVEWQNTLGHHNVNGTIVTFPSNPESFGNSVGMGWTYQHVFNTVGKYDYRCDPHYLGGMTGKIEVQDTGGNDDDKYKLTINFNGMTPHVGQTLWLRVVNKDSGEEIARKSATVAVAFSMELSGLELNHSYNVDFFADHNKDGDYDEPSTDHAWRLELNDVMGDTTLNFQHNTNFTDIDWKNKLTVHFMGMNPHVGQNLHLTVIDKNSGMELQRVSVVATVDFIVEVFGIENGKTYNVDFFADHNKDGDYDDPSTDHAWRLELNDVMGDTTLNFQHNTNFTDIDWKNKLTVHFMGMNPHVGENLHLAVIDKNSGEELQRVSVVAAVDFMVDVFGIENGKSYNIDFFADHNNNGSYDAPSTDHAWRLELNDVMGDTTLNFQHNTNFTDINWITTSVSEPENMSLKIYPNPASDRLFVEINEISELNSQLSIFEINGKIKNQEIKRYNNRFEIDIRNLNRGIYFVSLRTNDKQKILKFIKY